MDLIIFLKTYLNILDGNEKIDDDLIIMLYHRIILSLHKKIQ